MKPLIPSCRIQLKQWFINNIIYIILLSFLKAAAQQYNKIFFLLQSATQQFPSSPKRYNKTMEMQSSAKRTAARRLDSDASSRKWTTTQQWRSVEMKPRQTQKQMQKWNPTLKRVCFLVNGKGMGKNVNLYELS